MSEPMHNPRTPCTDIDSMFCDRWSPRAFNGVLLSDSVVRRLVEAARWAPSCFNEQPWLFYCANTAATRARYLEALNPFNQRWAGSAGLLVFLAARTTFVRNGEDNRYAWFDCGAAWMALSLQARKLGLHAHAMGGFSRRKATALIGLPEEMQVVAAIAVGYRGDSRGLPDDLLDQEYPGERCPLEDTLRLNVVRPAQS